MAPRSAGIQPIGRPQSRDFFFWQPPRSRSSSSSAGQRQATAWFMTPEIRSDGFFFFPVFFSVLSFVNSATAHLLLRLAEMRSPRDLGHKRNISLIFSSSRSSNYSMFRWLTRISRNEVAKRRWSTPELGTQIGCGRIISLRYGFLGMTIMLKQRLLTLQQGIPFWFLAVIIEWKTNWKCEYLEFVWASLAKRFTFYGKNKLRGNLSIF